MYKLTLTQTVMHTYTDNGKDVSYDSKETITINCKSLQDAVNIVKEIEVSGNMETIEVSISKTTEGEIDVL